MEAYVNPDLPPDKDLGQLVGKVKEFIYLLEDLTPDQVQGLGMGNSKPSCRNNCAMLMTSRRARSNSSVRA